MFTRTIVDLADCHTSLYHLVSSARTPAPLPVRTPDKYQELYRRIMAAGKLDYAEASGAGTGSILRKLEPSCAQDNFWRRYLYSDDYASYPARAWDACLPVQASLSARVECLPDPQFGCKVSLLPRVLLLPFGWSTWVSLLITGDHDLGGLSAFIQRIFNDPIFNVSSRPSPLSLQEVLSYISQGIRSDAFGGDATRDSGGPDILVVTTVLAKRQGSLSWQGFSPAEEDAVRQIVLPKGPTPKKLFESQIYELDMKDGVLNFLVMDTFGRFIWSQRLLLSTGRNQRHLRCYHNNTFRSFVLAWHQRELLEALLRLNDRKRLAPRLRQLAQNALSMLESPPYRSASLRAFLEEPIVTHTITRAQSLP